VALPMLFDNLVASAVLFDCGERVDHEIHPFEVGCSNLPPFTGAYECVDLQLGITP
jgi:hypothetical protein